MLSNPVLCSLLYLSAFGATASISYSTKSLPSVLVRPADNAEYYCTSSPNWTTTTWDSRDCLGAIQQVQHLEFETKRINVYEFVEAGAPQLSPFFYGQATPRKYVYNSCTLSIVMMNDTKIQPVKRLLPQNITHHLDDNSTFAKTDFTTYQDVWYAFRQTYLLCAQEYQVPGWIAIGNDLSIGIFLHATNSTIDQRINATEQNTTVADSLPTGWAYLGCNYGSASSTSIVQSWAGEGLSLARCAEYCADYQYFGVKAGSECYCGNRTFTTYTANGGEMACNTSCNGNATEICGGVDSMSVYRNYLDRTFVLPSWGVNNG